MGSAWRQWTAAALMCLLLPSCLIFLSMPVPGSRWQRDPHTEVRQSTAAYCPHYNYTVALCNFGITNWSPVACLQRARKNQTQQNDNRKMERFTLNFQSDPKEAAAVLAHWIREEMFFLAQPCPRERAANRPLATSFSTTWSSTIPD